MHPNSPQINNSATDQELVAQYLAGESAAMAAIYNRYSDPLYDYAMRASGSPHQAADAVQHTFMTAMEKLGSLRNPGSLKPWLYAITRNVLMRTSRDRSTPSEPDVFAEMASTSAEPATAAIASETAELVAAALRGLDERDRLVILLSDRSGLSGAELAQALEVQQDHAYKLVGNARQRFKRSLSVVIALDDPNNPCPELQQIAGDVTDGLTPAIRKRVARHIDTCEACEASTTRGIASVQTLAALPMLLAPDSIKMQLGFSSAAVAGAPTSPALSQPVAFDAATTPASSLAVATKGVSVALVGMGAAAVVAVLVAVVVFRSSGTETTEPAVDDPSSSEAAIDLENVDQSVRLTSAGSGDQVVLRSSGSGRVAVGVTVETSSTTSFGEINEVVTDSLEHQVAVLVESQPDGVRLYVAPDPDGPQAASLPEVGLSVLDFTPTGIPTGIQNAPIGLYQLPHLVLRVPNEPVGRGAVWRYRIDESSAAEATVTVVALGDSWVDVTIEVGVIDDALEYELLVVGRYDRVSLLAESLRSESHLQYSSVAVANGAEVQALAAEDIVITYQVEAS